MFWTSIISRSQSINNDNLNTLKRLICGLKDPIPQQEQSGVYKINCNDCPAIYIDETERQISTRVNEHTEAYNSRLRRRNSTFAEHLLQSGHTFQKDDVQLLHIESSYFTRRASEDIEITRHSNISLE